MKYVTFLFRYFYSGSAFRTNVYKNLIIYFSEMEQFRVARYLSNRLEKIQGVTISPFAKIHPSVELRHPVGIVIGRGVVIGRNVTIYQNVTLGGRRIGDKDRGNFPRLNDDVTVFSGAVILGGIELGHGCIVGANSVVVDDVPAGVTVAGAPAKIIKRHGDGK